jgi:hypothetical protein
VYLLKYLEYSEPKFLGISLYILNSRLASPIIPIGLSFFEQEKKRRIIKKRFFILIISFNLEKDSLK